MAITDGITTEFYKHILKENGILEEIREVIVKARELVGDQFSSQCKLVAIKFRDEARPQLQLFVKVEIPCPELAAEYKFLELFPREALFYNTLLPGVKTFAEEQPKYDGFLDSLFPKCYFANEDIIVLDNIIHAGYYIWPGSHDLEIATMVIKSFAKLHASTLAYAEHLGRPEFEGKYGHMNKRNFRGKEGEVINGPVVQYCLDGALQILKEKPTPGSEKVLEFLQQYEGCLYEKVSKMYERGNQLCPDVVIHTDLGNGNIMFRDNPQTKLPDQMVILDMQTIVLGTPALDLQRYAFTTLDPQVLHSSWKELVTMYYDYFRQLVENLGQEITFSLQDLVRDFKAKSIEGFFFGLARAFPCEAADDDGDKDGSEDAAEYNVEDFTAMYRALDRAMEMMGFQFSQNIVKYFEIYEDILGDVP